MTDPRLLAYRYRRPLAAACAALAVLLLALAVRPTAGDASPIVTAAADLPAGSVLSADDLSAVAYPIALVPSGAVTDPHDIVGRTLAGPISAGEPLTVTRLVFSEPRADGLQTVPVRLADAETAALLTPGSVVDIVRPRGDVGDVVAEGALVVTVPRPDDGRVFGASSRSAGSLIVVATDRRTAIALAAVGSRGGLGVVIR